MSKNWKIVLAVVAAILLAIITQPLWRYQVWVTANSLPARYDRLTGNMEKWWEGRWHKDVL